MPNINYNPTTWVNEQTQLNAQNMNNIDRGINDIIASLGEIPSWALNPTKPTYTATEVGADPTGTATTASANAVSTHNASGSAHSSLFNGKANTVHTHTLSAITDFPVPASGDDGKVLSVNNQNKWAIGAKIPTKISELENDAGYATTQMDLAEYDGGYVTSEQDFVFGFRPNHIVIEEYASGSTTPTSMHLNDDYSHSGTEVTFVDWGITIVSPSNGEFNKTGYHYKVYGYAFPQSSPSIDGHMLVASNNTWVDVDPASIGITQVIANPSESATDTITKIGIGSGVYQITIPIDDAISGSSTNPVQNKVVYNQLVGKESTANKSTDFTTLNNTKYPTTQAVANYLAGQIVANSSDTPTQTLSAIKIGSTVYEIKEDSPILPITITDFSSDDTSDPKRQFKFKVSSADTSAIAERLNEDFILSFQLAQSTYSLYGDAFAVSGRTYQNKKYFEGVIRIPVDNTQTLGADILNFSMTYDSSATYPFEMYIAYADSTLNASSNRPIANKAVNTALGLKEDTANKATDFTTLNNVKFPTTSAVSTYLGQYVVGNGSGDTSNTNLEYLRIGGSVFKIPTSSSAVEANPATTTDTLTGIKIAGTGYKVSNVVANVSTVGESPAILSTLSVDGTKYRVPAVNANPSTALASISKISIDGISYYIRPTQCAYVSNATAVTVRNSEDKIVDITYTSIPTGAVIDKIDLFIMVSGGTSPRVFSITMKDASTGIITNPTGGSGYCQFSVLSSVSGTTTITTLEVTSNTLYTTPFASGDVGVPYATKVYYHI